MKIRRRRREAGFTLIELLLVVVIIGILAAIVVPKLVGRSEEAREAKAKGDLATFRTALGAYEVDNGRFPSTDQGLAALVFKPSVAPEPKKWKGPYIEGSDVPKDPWDNPYLYAYPGSMNVNSYDLFSAGPDGQPGTGDDIKN
jgi:general secretion pathway protein G